MLKFYWANQNLGRLFGRAGEGRGVKGTGKAWKGEWERVGHLELI